MTKILRANHLRWEHILEIAIYQTCIVCIVACVQAGVLIVPTRINTSPGVRIASLCAIASRAASPNCSQAGNKVFSAGDHAFGALLAGGGGYLICTIKLILCEFGDTVLFCSS